MDDVLARFLGALAASGPAEQVVRLTGDCPLADPAVIDATIDAGDGGRTISVPAYAAGRAVPGWAHVPEELDVVCNDGERTATAPNAAAGPEGANTSPGRCTAAPTSTPRPS